MSTRTAVATTPSRAEWLGARAALAVRRSGRIALFAGAAFVTVLLALLLVPRFSGASAVLPLSAVTRADTVPLRQRADSAHAISAAADSALNAALSLAESMIGVSPLLSEVERQRADSLQVLMSPLDGQLDRAAKAPLGPSYRALAAVPALRDDPRVSALVDSLDTIERERAAADPTSAERVFANLATRTNTIGQLIREIAMRRRSQLARDIASLQSAPVADTAATVNRLRAARDSAQAFAFSADSAMRAARIADAVADSVEQAASTKETRRVPPVAMLIAATVIGLLAGFSIMLSAEIGRATVASAREAEWATGAPVVATVRAHQLRAPGDQENGGMIDPFRMLFLALTATGTRTRTVAINGDDRGVVATVSGRLALAAAADERATLVVDVDAGSSVVAGYYLQPPEPGFTDALAGVRLWREVARPVGASNRLAMDVVPAGTIRRDRPEADAPASAREEFSRFRSEYDFSVLVSPDGGDLIAVRALIDDLPTVICAEIGRTTVTALRTMAQKLRDGGVTVHGVVLWDGDSPLVASRSEQLHFSSPHHSQHRAVPQ